MSAAWALLFIAGCSGTLVPVTPAPGTPSPKPTAVPEISGQPSESSGAGTETGTPSTEASSSPSAEPTMVELAIATAADADAFSYASATLEVPPGASVELTLMNMTDPDDEVGHNWVLVLPGQEDSVLSSGIAAGDDNDWLDEADPGVIAATGLIEGGQRDTVTFAAPPPGTYTFLCTFPEHHAGGMKGTLIVR